MAFLHQIVVALLVLAMVQDQLIAAPCLEGDAMMCVNPVIQMISSGQPVTPEKMCPLMDHMTTCLGAVLETCEPTSQQQKQIEDMSSSKDMINLKALCAGSGGSNSGCSVTSMQACLGGVQMEKLNTISQADACKIKDCLAPMQSSCTEESMKKTLNSMTTMLSSMCGGGDGEARCLPADIKSCMSKMPTKPTTTADIKNSCFATKEGALCIKKILPYCEGEMKTNMEKALKEMESVMIEGCCESLEKIYKDCVTDVTGDFQPEDKSCMNQENSYACLLETKSPCTGEFKSGLNDAKSAMKKNLDKCESIGYNITNPILTGKRSGGGSDAATSLQPTVIVLFACLLGLITYWF